MRRLIAIALSLLCIALPLQSTAGAMMNGEHCPMMQAQTQEMAASHADSSDGHDCCNDAATFARTGQLCKTGQACSPPIAYLLPSAMLQPAIAVQHAALTTVSTPLHTRPPGAVWRPPNLG